MAIKNDSTAFVSDPGAGATKPVQFSPPAPASKAPRLVSFGIYFQSLGKPAHHAAGMAKYAPTKYPRTMEDWARVFKDY